MGAATLAGSETTALATAWLLHLLAGDPPAYARARAEVIGRVYAKAASARTCLLRVSRPSRRLGDHWLAPAARTEAIINLGIRNCQLKNTSQVLARPR